MDNFLYREHKRNGFDVFRETMNGMLFIAREDCLRVAKEETEGKSRDEIVEFVADMLVGITSLRQAVINTHLFGSPDTRL